MGGRSAEIGSERIAEVVFLVCNNVGNLGGYLACLIVNLFDVVAEFICTKQELVKLLITLKVCLESRNKLVGILRTLLEQLVYGAEAVGYNACAVDKAAASVIFCTLLMNIPCVYSVVLSAHKAGKERNTLS